MFEEFPGDLANLSPVAVSNLSAEILVEQIGIKVDRQAFAHHSRKKV